ncbi:MAG: 16S rRNA (cytidine(1402)-2'-O)-methyltransferase [Deltaproteobacteria bacterium]|nr:16S rRNA (cytidine(1402)-2'-O)-methyltransferase [Deltaproteobacteria bacterium]
MPGTLFIVATPLGNLEDITFRAVRILTSVGLIAAEDTRRTRNLLTHFGLKTRLISYREQNHHRIMPRILSALHDNEDVALVSDAGTPGVSDPGILLVQESVAAGIKIVPVPGPSAVATSLSVAGLPADRYFFGGFLPVKTIARRKTLDGMKNLPWTLVFFEAPHRLAETLVDLKSVLGDRPAVVCRELTKINEELCRGRLDQLAEYWSNSLDQVKGEITIVVAGADPSEKALLAPDEVRDLVRGDQRPIRAIVADLQGRTSLTRSELYRLIVEITRPDN